MRFWLLTFAISGFARSAHAGGNAAEKAGIACYEEMRRPGTFHSDTFPRLIAWLVSMRGKADDSLYAGPLAEMLGLPNGSHGPAIEAPPEQTSDYLMHKAAVVLDEADSAKPEPTAVVFRTRTVISKFADEDDYFRVDPDGTLERAFSLPGKRDENDKVIEGSGRPVVLDIKNPETRYRFQHEMDFWLKGVFLRPNIVPRVARKTNNSDSQAVKDAPSSKTSP